MDNLKIRGDALPNPPWEERPAGCDDTVTGVAFGYIPEIIDFIRKTNIE